MNQRKRQEFKCDYIARIELREKEELNSRHGADKPARHGRQVFLG
jgi:hypothetical protein